MALQRDTYYPGRYSTGNAAHPQGAFKNRTTPTSQDGSYLEKDWLNDWDGFFASLLNKAGLTPNNNVDAVGASQYFTALQDVISRGDYVTAGGTANAITLTHPTPVTSYKDGQVFRFKAIAANTGATTINVDGLGVKTLYGLAGLACQGGETAANGYCIAVYSTALAACVLLICTGGSLQVPNATQTHHAVSLDQFNASKAVSGYQKLPSGLIAQWGTTTIPTTVSGQTVEGDKAITFPITFPTQVFNVFGSVITDVGNGACETCRPTSFTTSGAGLRAMAVAVTSGIAPTATIVTVYWLAIGY